MVYRQSVSLTIRHGMKKSFVPNIGRWSNFQSNKYFATRVIKVPTMGDSITEGTINEWKTQPGEFVQQDGLVAIIDTDKVSVDINAPATGTITKHLANQGDAVLVGQDLFEMEEGKERQVQSESAPQIVAETTNEPQQKTGSAPTPETPPPTSSPPAAAAEKVVIQQDSMPKKPEKEIPPPLAQVKAVSQDSGKQKCTTAASQSTKGPQVTLEQNNRMEDRVPLNNLRKRIASRLKSAQNTAASLTTFNECDMGNLIAMRSELQDEYVKTHGRKFGFVSPFLYSASRALMAMPQMNAYISEAGDQIIYKNYADISVAVATPKGLLVPVVRDCEKKTISELEDDLNQLAIKAREGKIALEEMAGGTFTISNGGVYGSLLGTPILNPPQSSILGLHATKDRPVVKNGEVIIRPMMYLALTYDHRLVDGREAVLFLNKIKDGIEDPRRLLLNI